MGSFRDIKVLVDKLSEDITFQVCKQSSFHPHWGNLKKRRHWSWWNFRSRLLSRLCRSSKCNNFAWVLLKGNSWEEGCGEWRVHQSRSKHLPTWTLLALDRHLHLRKIGDGWRSGYLKAVWTENRWWRIRSINNLVKWKGHDDLTCKFKKAEVASWNMILNDDDYFEEGKLLLW